LIHTYRLCHHSKNDDDRPADEVAGRWALDPLVIHGRRLDASTRGRVEEQVAAALAEVAVLAGQAP
jgi:TPP-dependent pyruvate/acetoin dehydrogenase alpha subunit